MQRDAGANSHHLLALLELMKTKQVICRQEKLFDEILIVAVGEKEEGVH